MERRLSHHNNNMAPTETADRFPSTIGDAALAVLRGEAAKMPQLSTAVFATGDAEAIHALRVAIRRVRSAIRIFGRFLPSAVSELDSPLHELFRELGRVRDFDTAIAAWDRRHVPSPCGAEVPASLKPARSTAMLTLTVSIAKENPLDRLAEAVDSKSPEGAGTLPATTSAVPRLLHRAYRAVRRSARDLSAKSSPEEVHRLRRRLKRLRYGVEFFASESDKAAKFIDGLKELQDLLGAHQDSLVAARVLGEYAVVSAEAQPYVEAAIDSLNAGARKLRARITKAAAKFAGDSLTKRALKAILIFKTAGPASDQLRPKRASKSEAILA
ncbi:MAG: CHAD domain-containing protein [Fimbriimonadaceae bacterium]